MLPLFYPEEDQPPPVGIARVVAGEVAAEVALLRRLHSSVTAGCADSSNLIIIFSKPVLSPQ